MKKLFLFAAVAVFGLTNIDAQEFNLGVSAGLPVGDAGDSYTFNVTVDANYLWEVADQFNAGIATGISYNFGDEISLGSLGSIDVDDAVFLPVAAAGRLAVTDEFTIGADIGYAIGIAPDSNDGGFYYAPKLQYGVSENLDIVAAYRGVSLDGGSFDTITLGVEFGI